MPEGTEEAQILIVDDTPANLDLLARLLRLNHYRVRAVPSGRMALESARLSPPELILLDIRMPEMDGYQVCLALKADEGLRDIPVLFISALDDAWDKVKAFQVGGADYLTKPFQAEEVLVRVGHQILLRRAGEKVREQVQSLELANLKLLEVDKMRRGLTSMLVHDLRSPLQGIALMMSLYRQRQEIPELNLQMAERTVQDMDTLLTDLLEVFRSTAADLPLEIQPVDLGELARQAHITQMALAAERQIQLDLDLPSGPFGVQADPRLAARALGNLVGNAIKYTPPGGRACIQLEDCADGGLESPSRWMVLRVKDSGRGIPVEELPFIFEPFHQVLSRDAGLGFGLGLSIVQRIMRAHGGQVTVESQAGLGSQFSLWFPRGLAQEPRVEQIPS